MVACPGSSRAIQKGRAAVAQQLVLGRSTTKKGSCLTRVRWILVALAVILACGAGVPFVLLGLVLGDGGPDDGGPDPSSAGTTEPGPAAADGEPTAEGPDHEL